MGKHFKYINERTKCVVGSDDVVVFRIGSEYKRPPRRVHCIPNVLRV